MIAAGTTRRRHGFRAALCATTCLVSVACPTLPALAAPSGPSVVAGLASVASTLNSTVVQQNSAKAIINWNALSLAQGQSLAFKQPNSSAITLNRVTGGGSSVFDGTLTANGQVWIVNPNGMMFDNGAQINVGGLLATTSDIRNQDFLSGNYQFGIASPNPAASIVNRGVLQASPGGSIVLSAAQVDNEGVIDAILGSVVLAGAKTFTVDFFGDKLLTFAITGPVDASASAVDNSGTIRANGGKVTLTARAAGAVVDNLINTIGIVQANSVSMNNGTVTLDAGGGGVTVGGQVSAAGAGAGETGGTITASGGTIQVAAGARLDASGQSGGGSVALGDWQANAATMAAGSRIDASATTAGKGGKVSVIAATTTVAGQILARGGAAGGDGGTVETSGHSLAFGGVRVDVGAAKGKAGAWTLDPTDLTVDAAAATAITSALGSGNVTLDVSNPTGSLTTIPTNLGLTGVTGSGNITVTAPIAWTSNNSLTLNAYNAIALNANIGGNGTSGAFSALAKQIAISATVTAPSITLNAGSGVAGQVAISQASGSALTATAGWS